MMYSSKHLILPLLLVVTILSSGVSGRRLTGPCNIPLDPDTHDSEHRSCIQACLGKLHRVEQSFVCDISADWMHHVGGTNQWYPATPPKGTGVHEYVAYTGTPPCRQNGHCVGCGANFVSGKRLCSIFIDPEDCSVTCDETSTLMESGLTDF
ncbi:exostoses (multiple)-like 2 [Seminavis robusta]|uniref:Exostoses (Multiple)-like 2 n=1 Tax=Seminavis robusta TaxID=568900 RepID=A0A9N8ECT8_9STRA|nr:exostoses (multiple)-like 2 [Seminavis robusta]|eukprot:Sro987_g228220.1 exostoses (multiple)-like 2 (152) ;mRNA; r:7344-7799